MNKVFWLLLLSVYMSGCTPTGGGGDYLENEKIVSLISGHTLTGTFVSGRYEGKSFDIFMMENGKLSSRLPHRKGFGTWLVTAGGKLCAWQSHVKNGEMVCRLLRQDGDGYLLIRPKDNSANMSFRVLPGNARNLEIP